LASASTDASGAFEIGGTSGSIAPADQWLRVTLPDSSQLRAYPTGWTELSEGTEVAVSQIARLRASGAFAARVLPGADLAVGQESLNLLWQAKYAGQGGGGRDALAAALLLSGVWNDYLAYLARTTTGTGPGDVAALLPPDPVSFTAPATLADGAITSAVNLTTNCIAPGGGRTSECSLSVPGNASTSEQLSLRPGGILLHMIATDQGLTKLMEQVGDLPLIAPAPEIGTKVIYENLKLVQNSDPTIHAAIRVTRRTYPAAPVQALGGAVQAIQVVLDYEIAVLNTGTGKQADLLIRERRWFTPFRGRVRVQSEGLARSGAETTSSSMTLTANGGAFSGLPRLPFASPFDVKATALAHRDVVYSAALNRIYAATDSGVLELDPATMATLRSATLPGVTSRLAVAADGSRLYVGQNGGTVTELNTSDLAAVRQFAGVAGQAGTVYDRIVDLAVDPFDAERVLVLAGASRTFGTPGPLLLYRAGVLQLRDAPQSQSADYGWAKYSPGAVGWTGVRDEFLAAFVGSPRSLYRIGAGAGSYSLLNAQTDVADDLDVREAGGELVTPKGRILDPVTLATLRALGLGEYGLDTCMRIDAASDMCRVTNSYSGQDFLYVRLDNRTGAFLGAYRPGVATVLDQCPIDPASGRSLAAGGQRLTPMGDGRILVSNGDTSLHCGVQVWAPHELRR
jgi:hypothetical protein